MGTSVRKTSAKIKKLLKDTITDNPNTDYNDVIPEVAKEVIKSKKTKNYFSTSDFEILVGGGISCFRKAATIGYEGFVKDFGYDPEKMTVIEAEKIIESILDSIEEENGDIESALILSAFKITMCELLLDKTTNPTEFLLMYCQKFFELIIREEANETLVEAFKDANAREISATIAQFASDYVNNNYLASIQKCISKTMKIKELINLLQKEL